jgi:hypothetical protein
VDINAKEDIDGCNRSCLPLAGKLEWVGKSKFKLLHYSSRDVGDGFILYVQLGTKMMVWKKLKRRAMGRSLQEKKVNKK